VVIHDEFSQAVCSLTPVRVRALRDAGIPESPHVVGVADITTGPGGHFDFHESGRLAVILPCGEWDGVDWVLEDLVAFHLDRPDRWWLRRGGATVLGVVNTFTIEPRTLHATPLDWLKAGACGLCILDWTGNPVDRLAGAGHLHAAQSLKEKLHAAAELAAAQSVRNLFYDGR
jgi:hypothetical protein